MLMVGVISEHNGLLCRKFEILHGNYKVVFDNQIQLPSGQITLSKYTFEGKDILKAYLSMRDSEVNVFSDEVIEYLNSLYPEEFL